MVSSTVDEGENARTVSASPPVMDTVKVSLLFPPTSMLSGPSNENGPSS